MFQLSPISRAWMLATSRPFFVSLFVLVSVSSLLLTTQLILRAPFVPTPVGVIHVWLALLPETLGLLAPAALLLSVVLTARKWHDSGDMVALSAGGNGGRVLLRSTVVMGLVVGVAVAFCTQVFGPFGRTAAREALAEAGSTAKLRPGTMIQVGEVWVRVGSRKDAELEDVTIIGDTWSAWAPNAKQTESGGIRLLNGRARGLDEQWSMEFQAASISLERSSLGVHNFDRSHSDLSARIVQMESKGRNASRERLTLYKRTTLPVVVPLLALMGIPLGVMGRRPYLTTVNVILVLWAVQRLGDHGTAMWSPEAMALLPLVFVLAGVFAVFRGWANR